MLFYKQESGLCCKPTLRYHKLYCNIVYHISPKNAIPILPIFSIGIPLFYMVFLCNYAFLHTGMDLYLPIFFRCRRDGKRLYKNPPLPLFSSGGSVCTTNFPQPVENSCGKPRQNVKQPYFSHKVFNSLWRTSQKRPPIYCGGGREMTEFAEFTGFDP